MEHLTPLQAQTRLSEQKAILLDVREDWELAIASIDGATHIPMNQIPNRLDDLKPEATIMVICHSGVRSQNVANYLIQEGYQTVFNVAGGTESWSQTVDSTLPSY